MRTILLVGVGGFVGALLRYWLGLSLALWIGVERSYLATFVINVTGCLLIGCLSRLPGFGAGSDPRLLAIVGFLGAYTTFSTFGNETLGLLQNGLSGQAALYVLGSVAIGLLAVWLGQQIATWVG